jgi:hypothetical protein
MRTVPSSSSSGSHSSSSRGSRPRLLAASRTVLMALALCPGRASMWKSYSSSSTVSVMSWSGELNSARHPPGVVEVPAPSLFSTRSLPLCKCR